MEALCDYLIRKLSLGDLKKMLRSLRLLDDASIADVETAPGEFEITCNH